MKKYTTIEMGNTLELFINVTKKRISQKIVFVKTNDKTFECSSLASNYAELKGFTVGSMDINSPIALSRDHKRVAKWSNIKREEWRYIGGLLLSEDFRNDDVLLFLFTDDDAICGCIKDRGTYIKDKLQYCSQCDRLLASLMG